MIKQTIGMSLPIGMGPQKIIDQLEIIKHNNGAEYAEVEVHGKRVDIILWFGEMPTTIPYEIPKLPLLTLPIGYDMEGKLITLNMKSDAHPFLLVGGNPGTGKSVFLNGCMYALSRYGKGLIRFVLIDMKMGCELGDWFNLPEKQCWHHAEDPTKPELPYVLGELLAEIKKRYRLFKKAGVKKLEEYNKQADKKEHYIMIIIDEYAELKNSDAGKDYEDSLKSILQLGRAAGVRCICATQRPTVDCVSGTIKAVFTDRLAFAVSSALNSRIILDCDGAEKIPSDIPGRCILLTGSKFQTLQVPYFSMDSIQDSTKTSHKTRNHSKDASNMQNIAIEN